MQKITLEAGANIRAGQFVTEIDGRAYPAMTATRAARRSEITPEQAAAIDREFRAYIKPWLDHKAAIMSLTMPKVMLDAKTFEFISSTLDPETQAALDECDRQIERIASDLRISRGY